MHGTALAPGGSTDCLRPLLLLLLLLVLPVQVPFSYPFVESFRLSMLAMSHR
jgi:hypothetical protein